MTTRILAALLLFLIFVSQTGLAVADGPVLERNVRAQMEFLAGDALQGRGSGTEFERLAAVYLGSQMMQFGLEPAGDGEGAKRSFVQNVSITRTAFSSGPTLKIGRDVPVEHGKGMLVLRMSSPDASGSLQKIDAAEKPRDGAVALVRATEPIPNQQIQALMSSGAAAVVIRETQQYRTNWQRFASRAVSFTQIGDKPRAKSPALIVANTEQWERMAILDDGVPVTIGGELAPPQTQRTWNAVGKITGTDKERSQEVILLSAHLDHLGVRPNAPGEDKIYNGADDDASGCAAVVELARVLGAGPKPKRTVYFAFYGSEEAGGFGSQYFVDNLEFPKEKLVANLQFEMIGRPDPKVKADELWLTGYERSNLGPELAKQGAKLVADPHPEQNFFQRSDNFTLARQGIVAHTVSSFGIHKDYHQPSDELSTIDFPHMTRSINSLVTPIRWLVNSDFRPQWVEGRKP